MFKEITIIGGAGHVGLAYALICVQNNIRVHINDTNEESINLIKNGSLPHKEKNGLTILKKAIKKNLITFSNSIKNIKINKINIVCLGTPIDEFLNPEHKILTNLFTDLSKFLRNNDHIILRSTVSPGTTRYLHKILNKKNKKIKVTFYPERFVQGYAIQEFKKFPQIIGPVDKKSENECKKFLKTFKNEIISLSPEEAEYTKLFLNSYRYIQFSIANQFYKIAKNSNLNYKKINHAMRFNYNRGKIPSPGFTAGPCLLKDTMQLYSYSKNDFSLGMVAMTINEGIVDFIVEKLNSQINLSKKTVGILGMAFKAESDDIRNSLSYKLKKILKLKARRVLTSDPYVKTDKDLIDINKLLKASDILILACPHKLYKKLKTQKPIINIWDI